MQFLFPRSKNYVNTQSVQPRSSCIFRRGIKGTGLYRSPWGVNDRLSDEELVILLSIDTNYTFILVPIWLKIRWGLEYPKLTEKIESLPPIFTRINLFISKTNLFLLSFKKKSNNKVFRRVLYFLELAEKILTDNLSDILRSFLWCNIIPWGAVCCF